MLEYLKELLLIGIACTLVGTVSLSIALVPLGGGMGGVVTLNPLAWGAITGLGMMIAKILFGSIIARKLPQGG